MMEKNQSSHISYSKMHKQATLKYSGKKQPLFWVMGSVGQESGQDIVELAYHLFQDVS